MDSQHGQCLLMFFQELAIGQLVSEQAPHDWQGQSTVKVGAKAQG
jgi:hypothetical protein